MTNKLLYSACGDVKVVEVPFVNISGYDPTNATTILATKPVVGQLRGFTKIRSTNDTNTVLNTPIAGVVVSVNEVSELASIDIAEGNVYLTSFSNQSEFDIDAFSKYVAGTPVFLDISADVTAEGVFASLAKVDDGGDVNQLVGIVYYNPADLPNNFSGTLPTYSATLTGNNSTVEVYELPVMIVRSVQFQVAA